MAKILVSSPETHFQSSYKNDNVAISRWRKKAQDQGIKIHLMVPQAIQDGICTRHKSQSKSPFTPFSDVLTPHSASSNDTSGNLFSDIDNNCSLVQSCEKLRFKQRISQQKKGLTPAKQLDRFIPNRTTTNIEISHYKVTVNGNELQNDEQTDYQKSLESIIIGKPVNDYPVLSFCNKPTTEELAMKLKENIDDFQPKSKPLRQIPSVPERILDAPNLMDDCYLQLMDWSTNGNLAIALYNTIYIWNYIDDRVWMLLNIGDGEYISSVAWIEDGYVLAIGISNGMVQLWDVPEEKLLRSMVGHIGRIPSLSWNTYILSSGGRNGNIHHHDVRIPDQFIFSISAHDDEVCGLTWSSNGRYLSSGGIDCQLHIWNAINEQIPMYTFSEHSSAVKAMTWCPWQNSILATGGGVNDQNIRIWNINLGLCIENISTYSQICDLLWIENHHELISAHGDPYYNLVVWQYPNVKKSIELIGHTQRILSLGNSPDGDIVASAAADETIRLWSGFGINKAKKHSTTHENISIFSQSIR